MVLLFLEITQQIEDILVITIILRLLIIMLLLFLLLWFHLSVHSTEIVHLNLTIIRFFFDAHFS